MQPQLKIKIIFKLLSNVWLMNIQHRWAENELQSAERSF